MNIFLPILFIFSMLNVSAQAENSAVEIIYGQSKILSVAATSDTIAGIPVRFATTTIDAVQYIQTMCNYGNPSRNMYDSVHVIATISCVKDSSGILKTAICKDIYKAIEDEEAYAASNHYAASVVSGHAFYKAGTLDIPAIRTLNSSEGCYVVWYIDGYVYKIKLVEDNKIGNLNQLLRKNIWLKWNGNWLDANNKIFDIVTLRKLLKAQE